MKRSLALSGAVHAILLLAILLGGMPRLEVSAPRVIQVLLLDGAGGSGPAPRLGPAAPPSRAEARPSPPVRPAARRVKRVTAGGPAARRAPVLPAADVRPAAMAALLRPGDATGAAAGGDPARSGRGGGGGSGASGDGSAGGGEREERIAIIRRRIQEALVYPREARRHGIQGTSHVSFDLTDAGRLRTLALARSSGKTVLDDASLRTVERAQPFPFVDGTLIVPVVFRLSGIR